MRILLKGFAGLVCLLPLANAAILTSPSYTARADTDPGGIAFNYVDITATGTQLFPASDDVFATVNLGAPFPFFGETGSQAIVTSNGVITFEVGSNVFANDNLPTSSFSSRTLFPFWDDLFTTGYYQYFVTGAGPFSGPTSVIEWVGGYCGTGLTGCSTTGSVSFEALLEHNTGRILYQYASTLCPQGECIVNHDNGASATVGIQSFGGSSAEALEWSFNTAAIADNSTVLFAPVPEPSTWFLLGAGLTGLGVIRRRRS